MPDDTIQVEPLTPHTGALIGGVDLSHPLTADQRSAIEAALIGHGVVFFRDQDLDAARLRRFARSFGDLHVPRTLDPKYGVPDHPEVTRIHADASSRFVAGEDWHSDMSCDDAPPLGTVLFMHTQPDTGGDTCFSNMYEAYDALSPSLQTFLHGKTALHDGARVFAKVNAPDGRAYPRATHPVVRTHPVSGRRALYVNKQFTAHIDGLPADESTAILQFLHAHVAKPQFQVRFRWRRNSVAFWDNRCLQHTAVWDYFPRVRSGLRVTIAGDRPA